MNDDDTKDEPVDEGGGTLKIWISGLLGGGAVGAFFGLASSACLLVVIAFCLVLFIFMVCS